MRVDSILVHYKLLEKPSTNVYVKSHGINVPTAKQPPGPTSTGIPSDPRTPNGSFSLPRNENPNSCTDCNGSSPDAPHYSDDGSSSCATLKKETKEQTPDDENFVAVLMHGFVAGSVHCWKQLTPLLLEIPNISAVLAFDRPGFGLTSRPLPPAPGGSYGTFLKKHRDGSEHVVEQRNPYTPEYSVYLMYRLLDCLNIKQNVILLGHASGGALAIRAALQNPNRVHGLALVAPSVYSEGFPNFVRSIFGARLGRRMVRQLVRSEIGEVTFRRAWYDTKAIPEATMQYYKNTLRLKNWDGALMEMSTCSDPSLVEKRLGELSASTLILHGLQDKLVPYADSEKIVDALKQKLIGSIQLVGMEKCGHVPHLERPEEVVRAINDFF